MYNIVKMFNIEGEIINISPLLNGLVNKTYLVETTYKKYLLQKINKFVFKNPKEVMENIDKITNHIINKNKQTLRIVKSNNLIYYYDISSKEYYRMYHFMNNCRNLTNVNESISMEVGKAIGDFQLTLLDYDTNNLVETISNFHHLSSRIEQLKNSYNKLEDNNYRKIKSGELYNYILSQYHKYLKIEELVKEGIIPVRVVHNDTKLNNIMFNRHNKAIAMIDLDTVMPGTVLYDYADSIRSTVSEADENETDLSKVKFNTNFFVSLTVGYLSKMFNKLTYDEIRQLINAIGLITLECSTRFLTDYLNNDVYFRTDYSEHNIDRAYNQITLYKDYLKNKNQWEKIIHSIYNRLMFNK